MWQRQPLLLLFCLVLLLTVGACSGLRDRSPAAYDLADRVKVLRDRGRDLDALANEVIDSSGTRRVDEFLSKIRPIRDGYASLIADARQAQATAPSDDDEQRFWRLFIEMVSLEKDVYNGFITALEQGGPFDPRDEMARVDELEEEVNKLL